MIRTIAIAALLLALAGPTMAASTHTAPYLDAAGKCHAANGQFAAASVCKPATPPPAARCRDKTTKRFVKCGSPNSEPVPGGH